MIFTGFLFLVSSYTVRAQSVPSTISVYTTQNLSFGAFIVGRSGGTVTVTPSGNRNATGGLILMNSGAFHFPATIEIAAPLGTIISILNGPAIQLSGSNGGNATLRLGTSDKGSSFVTSVPASQRTSVNIGGTLTVGSEQRNPAGSYSGTFSITFIQQ